MTADLSFDLELSLTLNGVAFERQADLHGQPRYKATDRLGRVWLVARDGSVEYPWRCTLLELRADLFAPTVMQAAQIIGDLTAEKAAAEQERGDVARVLFTGPLP